MRATERRPSTRRANEISARGISELIIETLHKLKGLGEVAAPASALLMLLLNKVYIEGSISQTFSDLLAECRLRAIRPLPCPQLTIP